MATSTKGKSTVYSDVKVNLQDAERIVMLFDFYGGLLTDRQNESISTYYNEDLTLAEMGQRDGVSRQAVRDTIVHGVRWLEYYEEHVGAFKRFMEQKKHIEEIESQIFRLNEINQVRFRSQSLVEICNTVMSELQALRNSEKDSEEV